jgi:hypothetical protein
MDLYRFFHPHHNPRLRSKPLRLQELSELELAARELHRALGRANLRISSFDTPVPTDLMVASSDAVELACELLHQMVELYPEDSEEEMRTLLEERKSAPGWEAWCNLLTERLEMLKNTFKKHNGEKSTSFVQENPPNDQSDLDDSFSSVSTLGEKKIVSA